MLIQKPHPNLNNEIAHPAFRGDKAALINQVGGASILQGRSIPPCFSDPNLESGICNPHLPLKDGEPFQCALHKSCLVAKLMACGIQIDPIDVQTKTYEEVLAFGDPLFDVSLEDEPDAEIENRDRLVVRAHALSISYGIAKNQFKKNSLRRTVFDLLTHDWISLSDLRATILSMGVSEKRIDSIIGQVTNIVSQENHDYRILESFGKFKIFKK